MFESAAAVAALKGRTLIFSEDNCKLLPLFTVTERKEKKVGKQPSQLLISLSFTLSLCVQCTVRYRYQRLTLTKKKKFG